MLCHSSMLRRVSQFYFLSGPIGKRGGLPESGGSSGLRADIVAQTRHSMKASRIIIDSSTPARLATTGLATGQPDALEPHRKYTADLPG